MWRALGNAALFLAREPSGHQGALCLAWLASSVSVTNGFAVLLEVGSRFETEESKGAAYFLDRLAYKVRPEC